MYYRFDMYQTFDTNAAGATEHAHLRFGSFRNANQSRPERGGDLVGGDGIWAAIESDGSASAPLAATRSSAAPMPQSAPPFGERFCPRLRHVLRRADHSKAFPVVHRAAMV